MADFRSARAKLGRAKEHLACLNEEVRIYRQGEAVTLLSEFDVHTATQTFTPERVRPVPDSIPLLIGDLAHNLRCCLDHIAWALGKDWAKEVGRAKPLSYTYFPLYTSRALFFGRSDKGTPKERWSDDSGMHKIEGISKRGQAFLKWQQPHRRLHLATAGALALIGSVNNFDKHRQFPFLSYAPKAWGTSPVSGASITYPRGPRLVEGAPFAVVAYECPGMQVEMELIEAPEIAVELSDGSYLYAADLGRRMVFVVDYFILPNAERLFP